MVEADFRLSLSSEEPVLYSRPAIDVLFESAADAYGDHLTGVVLTGASSDGARGLSAICAAGGVGLVQSPDTALGDTMPRAALAACAGARSLRLEENCGGVEECRFAAPSMTNPSAIKFLLVDDLEANLLALEGLLRRDGLELLRAHSGPEALELFARA